MPYKVNKDLKALVESIDDKALAEWMRPIDELEDNNINAEDVKVLRFHFDVPTLKAYDEEEIKKAIIRSIFYQIGAYCVNLEFEKDVTESFSTEEIDDIVDSEFIFMK